MREETKNLLLEKLKTLDNRFHEGDAIHELFFYYTEIELRSIDDLKSREFYTDFREFIADNAGFFTDVNKDKDGTVFLDDLRQIKSRTYLIMNPIMQTCVREPSVKQKEDKLFVDMIDHIISKKDSKILEVGSGNFPYSSYLLAKRFANVTSMDRFYVPNSTLKSFNINAINDFFTERTDISGYDYIIGKKPCWAIEPVVKTCAKESKPYFLQLCGCGAPLENNLPSWVPYLRKFDGNIRFSDKCQFAYNIDGGEELERYIDENELEFSMRPTFKLFI